MTYHDIHDKLEKVCRHEEERLIMKGIFENLERDGFCPEEERVRIIDVALNFLGYQYSLTEELSNENKIDCSTFISQSFWEGALIGVPFIADRQRTAPDAFPVKYCDLKPADVVVKFPDVESSNDKKHNHVGFYLGKYKDEDYVLECNSKDNCVITPMTEFNPAGGLRTFIKNEGVVVDDAAFAFLNKLSKAVPKVSRFGAKQPLKNSNDRVQHSGIDIFVPQGTEIRAPITGFLERGILENENLPTARIVSPDQSIEVVIGNIHVPVTNITVEAGSTIGIAFDFSESSKMNYPKVDSLTHIHFEVKLRRILDYWINSIDAGRYKYVNGMYAVKMRTIASPVLHTLHPEIAYNKSQQPVAHPGARGVQLTAK